MKQVNKEEFEQFIKEYPRELSSHYIGFTTPSSTIYCDFGLHPEMKPGLNRIQACIVAEHVDPNLYYEKSSDEYYIKKVCQ